MPWFFLQHQIVFLNSPARFAKKKCDVKKSLNISTWKFHVNHKSLKFPRDSKKNMWEQISDTAMSTDKFYPSVVLTQCHELKESSWSFLRPLGMMKFFASHKTLLVKCISGWWAREKPLWKIWVNWDDEISNIWENRKWQPNHQPGIYSWGKTLEYYCTIQMFIYFSGSWTLAFKVGLRYCGWLQNPSPKGCFSNPINNGMCFHPYNPSSLWVFTTVFNESYQDFAPPSTLDLVQFFNGASWRKFAKVGAKGVISSPLPTAWTNSAQLLGKTPQKPGKRGRSIQLYAVN